jgi:hypothetical protein
MFLKRSLDSRIADFWKWFTTNSSRFQIQGSIDEDLCDELGSRIQKIDRNLTFEIAPSDDGPFELVVSADGKKKTFPIVKAVVAAAPPLPAWKVTAFRQRTPLDSIELSFNGITLSPTTVFYVLIPDAGKLDLLVIMPDTDEEMLDHVIGAGFLLLDAALGEYDVAMKLRTIEFENRSAIDASIPSRPLVELPSEFDATFGNTA